MTRRAAGTLAVLAAAALAACAPPAPPAAAAPAPEAVVASAVPAGSDLCYITVRDALAKPNIDVDKVAEPLKMDPPAFKAPYPRGVFGKTNKMHIQIHVLVDTMGRADMSTFAVDTTSNPWFATQVKASVAKWKFSPAEKAGCKVPRIYKLGISMAAPRGSK